MKVAIVGCGAVGGSAAQSMLLRGSVNEIVLYDCFETTIQHKGKDLVVRRDRGLANDLIHGEPLSSYTKIRAGDYTEFAGAEVVVITAGVNEKGGNAIDRNDPLGRLRLLPDNAKIYQEIIPQVVEIAPDAIILVVTDPPDALAHVARLIAPKFEKATNPRIISSGTLLDSLRFRVQIGNHYNVHPNSVDAIVLGEHGLSKVCVWSQANVNGKKIQDLPQTTKEEIEGAVGFANIDIIEATDASQRAIGIVTARIVEAIVRDERIVLPVGVYQDQYGTNISVPTIVGKQIQPLQPNLSDDERFLLEKSARTILTEVQKLNL